MSIQLNDAIKLSEIKASFTELFPYLRVEFYTINRGKLREANDNSSLGTYRLSNTSDLQIQLTTTTKELKTWFEQGFYLSIKIYRKSGKSWLPTTLTDDWTLDYQNKLGKTVVF